MAFINSWVFINLGNSFLGWWKDVSVEVSRRTLHNFRLNFTECCKSWQIFNFSRKQSKYKSFSSETFCFLSLHWKSSTLGETPSKSQSKFCGCRSLENFPHPLEYMYMHVRTSKQISKMKSKESEFLVMFHLERNLFLATWLRCKYQVSNSLFHHTPFSCNFLLELSSKVNC